MNYSNSSSYEDYNKCHAHGQVADKELTSFNFSEKSNYFIVK